MADEVVLPACAFTSSASRECFAASWYLVWDQVRYWGLVQLPILCLSIIYEWLELSNVPRLERLRELFDAPLIQVSNQVFQVVASIYVCMAWIVRGGSLSVNFSSWSVESVFLIITGVGYGVRWIAAKHKVRYTIRLHSLFDLLSMISHFTLSFQTYPVDGRQRRSWLDFGFLRSYILYVVIGHLFTQYKHKTFFTQVLLVIFKVWCLIFFAACVLFSLEQLGDLPYTNTFLLHVYKCFNKDGQHILVYNSSGTDEFSSCKETWSFFTSIYFMFVTVSTVGYGDFSPKTVLGQLMVCAIIVVGIYTFANESAALMSIYGDMRHGRVKYDLSRNAAHVIVTGNPSAAQMKDFIREFFHPDHEALLRDVDDFGQGEHDDAEDDSDDEGRHDQERRDSTATSALKHDELEQGAPTSQKQKTASRRRRPWQRRGTRAQSIESTGTARTANSSMDGEVLASKWMQRRGANRVRETHIVILMPFYDDSNSGSGGGDSVVGGGSGLSFHDEIMEFVQENPRYQKRVFLVYGSPLRAKDLRNARLDQAMAVFFLPHKFSNDGSREDAATVLRVLSVSQQLKRGTHTQLFAMLVNSENRTLLEATGLRSENLVCADELRLGLMGLSCRCPGLSTLVSNLITSRSADVMNDPAKLAYIKPWVQEYIMGAAKEIYSCKLATHLHGLTFTQCTQRIHRQSDGQVLLIAIEDGNDILFNPGHSYRIHSQSRAFLIAESVSALQPFEAPDGDDLCPNVSVPYYVEKARAVLRQRARQAQHNVQRRLPNHVRYYATHCGGSISTFQQSSLHPDMELLLKGGHIIVCSNVATDGDGSRSISRLVSFLRPLRAPHVAKIVPVVIVDAQSFDGPSWLQLSDLGQVYHVQGSPQRHQVLVAAGLYRASAVVVLAQGTDGGGYDDSKAIFNAILMNAALQRNKDIFTIIELRDVHNNKYLDPVSSFSSRSFVDDNNNEADYFDLWESASMASPNPTMQRHSSPSRSSQASMMRRSGRNTQGPRGSAASNRPDSRRPGLEKATWWDKHVILMRETASRVFEFFTGSLQGAATRMHAIGTHAIAINAHGTPHISLEDLVSGEDETFFQERFMRGALFPSYVADDLLIQSFFNSSLNQFIGKILDGTSCFMLYDLPRQWRHGATYGQFFDYMTSGIASALPIGLLRAMGEHNGAPHPYVYTTPASDTLLHPDDKVFVIIDVHAVHRVANKLQRRFRSRRRQQDSGDSGDSGRPTMESFADVVGAVRASDMMATTPIADGISRCE